MAYPSKDFEMLHCKLERSLSDQLVLLAAEQKRSKTAVVEMALQDYFDRECKTSEALTRYRSENG